ncbi:MAG: hypothetical protein H6R10_1885 [Rhodocyclaceae bacterium]|nr:hypothetical protein [Rhodocyclaceae bacterium]
MDSTVDRVDFDRSGDIEARLFEAERQTAGAGKEIDSNRTSILIR